MNLFDIKCLVNRKYKDGDDWVYAKSKKAEIELIKDLLEICENQRNEILDLTKQVEVVDPWEAYRKAEHQLERVEKDLDCLRIHLIEYKQVADEMNKAWEKIEECRTYLKEIFDRIKENNAC